MAYTYSNAGDLLTLKHITAGGPQYTLTYTPAHQLETETLNNANFVWQPAATGTTSYGAANNLNQYPTVASVPQSYDANGNLTGDGTTTFTYDAENQLITASKTDLAATYQYDPLGRRTRKSGTGVTDTIFLSDGTDEIAEYAAGAITTRYIPGPAIDQTIAMVDASGAKSFFHTNRQGSLVAATDATNTRTEGPYTYDPYGNCFKGAQPCSALTATIPYKYTGRRLDPETGLYYYRARYYDPIKGRFLQTDPVGYDTDMNPYTYVGNDPTDKVDASGEGPYGWIVLLTKKGLVRIKPLLDKSAAVAARKAGKNVEVAGGRQAAGSVERASAQNANDVMRHPGHDLEEEAKGSPHFQTENKYGHTFYDLGAVVAGLIGVLDVLEQLDPFYIADTGCSPGIERCAGDPVEPSKSSTGVAPVKTSGSKPKPNSDSQKSGSSNSSDEPKPHLCTGSRIPTMETCSSF